MDRQEAERVAGSARPQANLTANLLGTAMPAATSSDHLVSCGCFITLSLDRVDNATHLILIMMDWKGV